jgi:hypothetical protein
MKAKKSRQPKCKWCGHSERNHTWDTDKQTMCRLKHCNCPFFAKKDE